MLTSLYQPFYRVYGIQCQMIHNKKILRVYLSLGRCSCRSWVRVKVIPKVPILLGSFKAWLDESECVPMRYHTVQLPILLVPAVAFTRPHVNIPSSHGLTLKYRGPSAASTQALFIGRYLNKSSSSYRNTRNRVSQLHCLSPCRNN